jgi:plastocyanin
MKAKIAALAVLMTASAHIATAAEIAVSQKDKAFAPGTVDAKVGDSVVFHNDDTVAHNVMSTGADKFNLGSIKPGASAQATLGAAGDVEVRCAIHPKMKLVIKVTE